jgi:hypothetical protein
VQRLLASLDTALPFWKKDDHNLRLRTVFGDPARVECQLDVE